MRCGGICLCAVCLPSLEVRFASCCVNVAALCAYCCIGACTAGAARNTPSLLLLSLALGCALLTKAAQPSHTSGVALLLRLPPLPAVEVSAGDAELGPDPPSSRPSSWALMQDNRKALAPLLRFTSSACKVCCLFGVAVHFRLRRVGLWRGWRRWLAGQPPAPWGLNCLPPFRCHRLRRG